MRNLSIHSEAIKLRILEGIIDLIDRVAIGYEVSGKVRHIAIKDVGR